jgi:hypothetical protein
MFVIIKILSFAIDIVNCLFSKKKNSVWDNSASDKPCPNQKKNH